MIRDNLEKPPPAGLDRILLLCAAGVFVLSVLVYLPTVRYDWVYDDHRIVQENPLVAQISLSRIFTSDYWEPHRKRGLYRPLTILSFGLNRRVTGRDSTSRRSRPVRSRVVTRARVHPASC